MTTRRRSATLAALALSAVVVANRIGTVSAQSAGPVVLTISGSVARPLLLSLADLKALPRAMVSMPAREGSATRYDGVLMAEVLTRAGATLG